MSYNAQDFKVRRRKAIPREKWNTLIENVLFEKDADMADDWVIGYNQAKGYTKFGRLMYSPSLDRLRHQTMGEFYGAGVVD